MVRRHKTPSQLLTGMQRNCKCDYRLCLLFLMVHIGFLFVSLRFRYLFCFSSLFSDIVFFSFFFPYLSLPHSPVLFRALSEYLLSGGLDS